MSGNLLFQDNLLHSLQYGFIDREVFQEGIYAPKILINDVTTHRYVLNDLQEELSKSKSFSFSVAFITQSGLALIKSQLSDLADDGIRGRILISPYLDFNDPIAMKELLKLKNVDVRMTPTDLQMHAKFYLFEQEDKQVIISGSSNLTHTALKINYEWNVKLTSTQNGDFIQNAKEEFEKIWEQSQVLTLESINAYATRRKTVIQTVIIQEEVTADYDGKIRPNKMQEQALEGLVNVRKNGAKKALVISATGTGKTYLSAFDVKQYNPGRMLFIVHREQILQKSLKDFQKVLGFDDDEGCLYKSGADISQKKYIFATIQTLSRDANLQSFDQAFFDYILIDEVHKAGAESYKRVMDYFQPDFYLGMTATPERTDGQNIYELFDYNIAYEIRLQEALDNDMLCPFIYYGVSDIKVDGQLIDEKSTFSNLVSEQRVQHILEKVSYYGVSGEKVRGLMFCSSKNEAKELEKQFNSRGLKTIALDGDNSQMERYQAVEDLENGKLDYILTVDIFNEGIDIPSLNQVVMLRNTQSSIIFIQQLGRGLRKHESKEYVTIIDFVGNYQNNYLIPVALFGDQSMNKDNYRREVREPNTLKGLTTINFEKIAKEQIFSSITNTTLSSIKILRDAYKDLENKLGRTPYLADYIKLNSIEPLIFFENSSFNNYADVITKFSDEMISLSEIEKKFLNFITFEVLNGKRKHELYLLKLLLENDGQVSSDKWFEYVLEHDLDIRSEVLESVNRVLDLSFLKTQEQKKYGTDALVSLVDETYQLNESVQKSLKENSQFALLFSDIIETGILKAKDYPQVFTLGQKYSRRDVLKLMNVRKDEPPLNIGGYKIDQETNSCPIFITYHKSEDISDTIKYEDELLNESTLRWFSKNKRTLESNDVSTIINSNENGLRLELFVIKDDSEGGEFYYLGPLIYVEGSADELLRNGDTVVQMRFNLEEPVEPNLYKYLTDK
ncbi:Helicase conserved C-terminal domain-containing protein [Streptococcus henryi]|uniref:Helicase conserved C-terminal domain-containing protein n=1 Tax=Streptococcus henryi TaxID=439219 RepID=A0A1G6AWI3_9STRE|nr:DEAD/DEAH box helicase [Streptococcus henryi]SDB12767.1 Helicase conserved C-terminal domain-containing protein [Streptococcus henryi]